MKFVTATIAGRTCRVLLFEHDWAQACRLTLGLAAAQEESITSIDERRPRSTAPLHRMQVALTLVAAEADELRQGIAATTTQLWALPIPVDVLPLAAWGSRVFEAEQVLNFDPASDAYSVIARGALPGDVTTLPRPLLAPLLIGRLRDRPEHTIIDGESISLTLELVERSPWDCRVGLRAGATPGWTAAPDWVGDVKEVSTLRLGETRLGLAREDVVDYPQAAARWRQEAQFTLDGRDEVRDHIAHFLDRRGPVLAWDGLPAWCQPGADTTATPHALRVKFAGEQLEVEFSPAGECVAVIRAAFLQEIATPGSPQDQAAVATLYRLTLLSEPWATPYVERYADWDAPVVASDGTYAPWPIRTRSERRALELQRDETEVEMAFATGTIAAHWLREWVDFPVRLEVLTIDPATPGATPTVEFSGTVASLRVRGSVAIFKASLVSAALKRKAPSWLFQNPCNSVIFDPVCALARDTYRTEAQLATGSGISSDGLTLTLTAAAGWKGPGAPADWVAQMFAGGFLVIDGRAPGGGAIGALPAGRAPVLRQITSSTSTGTTLTIGIGQPLGVDRLPAATYRVYLFPGCTGQPGAADQPRTCKWYGNYAAFGGYPFIPDYIAQRQLSNPSVKTTK
jgi:hypothetical protein